MTKHATAGRVIRPGAVEGPARPRPLAIGPLPEAPEELPSYITGPCIARFNEACRLEEAAYGLPDGGSPRGNPWSVFAGCLRIDAERNLITAILAHAEDFREADVHSSPRRRRPARGVRSGGLIYLAVDEDPEDLADEPDHGWRMALRVVEASAIVDLEPLP